ncbi:MAG TPA: hypothetical protein VKA48_05715, partial [Gammaproteobacteria bacterium]|nr:hypothetical protein [Gammaproteobacteria bacterium]
ARYEPGNVIDQQDWETARQLQDLAARGSSTATENIGEAPFLKAYTKVKHMIQRRGKVNRRDIITGLQRYGNASIFRQAIDQMEAAGLIEVHDTSGKRRAKPKHDKEDTYVWKAE